MTEHKATLVLNPDHLEVVYQGKESLDDFMAANEGVRLLLCRADFVGACLRNSEFKNADLRAANFMNADLRGANFSNADLRGALFGNANLEGASFIGSNLKGAEFCMTNLDRSYIEDSNLRGANLYSVKLRGAILDKVNLEGSTLCKAHLNVSVIGRSNLKKANLESASLLGANLYASDLTNANLTHAHLEGAVLLRCILHDTWFLEARLGNTTIVSDISDARHLSRVHHHAPSAVSWGLLLRPTRRPLPTQFLRGCGLSELEIKYTRTMASNALDYYSCFISYSTKNDKFAVKLHDSLQATGICCWLDKYEVQPGDNIYRSVNEGIRLWDKVLLCCSKESLTSWWVKDEVTKALEIERELEQERGGEVLKIIPLDLDGFLFSNDCKLEFASTLRKRHAAKFDGWDSDEEHFDAQLKRVVKALRADDLAKPPSPKPKL